MHYSRTLPIKLPIIVLFVAFLFSFSYSYEEEALNVTTEVESTSDTNNDEQDSSVTPDYVNIKGDGTENENQNETDANATLIATDPNLIAFYLYPKQENQSYNEELQIGDRSSIERSSFNPGHPVVFFIHGFLNNYTTRFTQSMKNAYLQQGIGEDENVVAVDWGKLATPENYTYGDNEFAPTYKDMSSDLFYQAAVRNVPKVGQRIAEFISFLATEKFLYSPTATHVIGFSLGAHVASFTGKNFKKIYNNNTLIQRITGLDPAGPLYQNEVAEKKLDSTDAAFVDVIHTNQGQEGYAGNLGHADFMPNNGGPNQPNCQSPGAIHSSVPDTVSGSCAHNRSWMYWIKTLKENIQACKCVNNVDLVLCRAMCSQKATFGRNCPSTARGNYYLDIVI